MNRGYQTASVRIKWEAPGVTSRYLDAVKNNLNSLELPHVLKPDEIENHLKSINEALHDAASVFDRTLRKSLKPKAYWCPDLSKLRDRKRFWWSLWVANDRPRTGAVFSCYKGVKKLFRKLQRGKINEVIESGFAKINNLFGERKMTAFWNGIKMKQRKHINSVL